MKQNKIDKTIFITVKTPKKQKMRSKSSAKTTERVSGSESVSRIRTNRPARPTPSSFQTEPNLTLTIAASRSRLRVVSLIMMTTASTNA